MTKVPDQTNQRQVTTHELVEWASLQGPWLPSGNHMAVLMYLCLYCFVSGENPEGEPPGSVLYKYSFTEEILAGTGIKSRETLRKVLVDLQEMGYILRSRRADHGTHHPHRIRVLAFSESLRDDIRAGRIDGVQAPPKAPEPKPKTRPDLRIVRESDVDAHD